MSAILTRQLFQQRATIINDWKAEFAKEARLISQNDPDLISMFNFGQARDEIPQVSPLIFPLT